MFDYSTAFIIIGLLIALVLLGLHVAVALGARSAVGVYPVTGKIRIVEALRDFTFAVISLFMLMGEFIGRSGVITDIFIAINNGLWKIPARLAIATLLGNTVFSFVTGVSIASTAAFSRIAPRANPRVQPRVRSRGDYRVQLPWHVDPPVRLDDRLGHIDRKIHRPSVSSWCDPGDDPSHIGYCLHRCDHHYAS